MINVAVVIPFYQTDTGILRRALEAVLKQRLSPNIKVQVVVVDDGSPVSAKSEVEKLTFSSPFGLMILTQSNGGVGKARNAGLQHVDHRFQYIAFLDSDDIWREDHLQQGIDALEVGNDLYFCDQSRDGQHSSHFARCKTLEGFPIEPSSTTTHPLITLTASQAQTAILREFVCQASTVIFRRSVAPDLFFNVTFKNAGEDMLYFLELASRASRVCFSAKTMVRCGDGVNIYFRNLNWNADDHLKRIVDMMTSHVLIQNTMNLSMDNGVWNQSYIASLRRDFAFHSLRRFVKAKGQWPADVHSLAKGDKVFKWWFTLCAIQVMIGTPLRLYKPR